MIAKRLLHSARCYSSSAKPMTTMQLIKKLREEIQAPLNIVKSAVTQAQPQGDYDAALTILKAEMTKRGEKLVAKSADRTASEGWVIAARSADGKSASLSVLNCETDFVAKSDKVVALASILGAEFATPSQQQQSTPSHSLGSGVHTALSQDEIDAFKVLPEAAPLKERLTEQMSLFGETIRMRRATQTSISTGVLGIHCHGGPSISQDVYLGRMGALVNLHSSESRDLTPIADEVAREIVAQNPESLEEFWTLEKVGDAQGRNVREWAGPDVQIRAWTRMERNS